MIGDDTEHTGIPNYNLPGYWESRAGFPSDNSNPEKVDLIFFDLYVDPISPCDITV